MGKQGYAYYVRRCRRCESFFKSPTKNSKICDDCKIPHRKRHLGVKQCRSFTRLVNA
jgi:hypothetical protein